MLKNKEQAIMILAVGLIVSFSFIVQAGVTAENPISDMMLVRAGTTSKDNGNIELDYNIFMGKYEITYEQYIEFLNDIEFSADGNYKRFIDYDDVDYAVGYDYKSNKYYFEGSSIADKEECPIVEVTWYGAVSFCNWLSEKEGLTPAYDINHWETKYELKGNPENLEGYRLPTSNEWGYTARGGLNGKNTTYSGSDNINEVAWYKGNSGEKTHPVGEKQANELGIYDMSGNVYEWTNTSDGFDRINRGGSWRRYYRESKVDSHLFLRPYKKKKQLGFRITKTK